MAPHIPSESGSRNSSKMERYYNGSIRRLTRRAPEGSVLSTDLYKLYINPLLDQIEDSGIGMQIGTIPCSGPTCADDVSLIADSEKNLQILIEFKAQLNSVIRLGRWGSFRL